MARSFLTALALCILLTASVSSHASSGTFIDTHGLKDLEPIDNFLSGGMGGFGSQGKHDYGITFSSNALAIKSYVQGGAGGFFPPLGNAPAIFFNSGTQGYMNVANGFTTGMQFFYAAGATMTVTVWSGANGTGTALATITLSSNSGSGNGCSGFPTFCNWTSVGLTFSGTGKSVTFKGPANQLAIADITIGSNVTALPEPSSLLLLGSGLVALSARFRKSGRARPRG